MLKRKLEDVDASSDSQTNDVEDVATKVFFYQGCFFRSVRLMRKVLMRRLQVTKLSRYPPRLVVLWRYVLGAQQFREYKCCNDPW